MKIGIYEQIINQLFEEKIASIDQTQFYIGERDIKRGEVARLLSMYLTNIFEQMLTDVAEVDADEDEEEEGQKYSAITKGIDLANSIIQKLVNEFHLEVMGLVLQGSKAYEKADNSLLADFPLKLHGIYTKAQIQVAIGTSTLSKKSPAREGVERNKLLNVEAMFVDIIKNREEGSTTDYDDKALSPYLFQWDTQNRVKPDSKEGQAYINQTQTMLLFVREQKNFVEDKSRTMGYVYLGRVTLSSWEYRNIGARMQMQIRWNMVEPIPGSVMHFARIREIA